MKKDFAESAGTPSEEQSKEEKKQPNAEKTTADLLALDAELKRHLAELLLHFSDPKSKTPLGIVTDKWVDRGGYTFMAFLAPKGLGPKKAAKTSVKIVEFLEELTEHDGKAYMETDRRYPYKREICVLFFKPSRLLKTLHALADEIGEGGKKRRSHFEMADTLIQRLGKYKPSGYIPGPGLH